MVGKFKNLPKKNRPDPEAHNVINWLPEHLILDWDSTVQSKYGHQQGAEVGGNPRKPGRRVFSRCGVTAQGAS
ncbi:MAG: transposase [Terrimicrobiaceae bacterium]|nr:transposase [Terrimicrobiaceae bacterium]